MPYMTCASVGTLPLPASVVTSAGVTSPASTASAQLRSLIRRRRRSSASATMSLSSSSPALPPRQMELGDDYRRLREPAAVSSISSSSSTFSSISGGDTTMERMMTEEWQIMSRTCRYMTCSSSPSDVGQRLFAQSSSISHTLRPADDPTLFHGTGVSSQTQPVAWRQSRRQPAAVTSLPVHTGPRDTPEMTSDVHRRPQSATASGPLLTSLLQLPPPPPPYHQNGDKSLPVRGWTSTLDPHSGPWTCDEPRLAACVGEQSPTTTTTTTSSDVWRPY